jgi:trimethylamine--corrinoid protein Co-methyltransferase
MLRNWSEILSPTEIEEIHNISIKLLATVGVRFPMEEALAIFRQHGVKVEGEVVYLTEDQVRWAVDQAPAQFTLHARNPERNVVVGGSIPAFVPAYGAPFVIDPRLGKRLPTVADYDHLARLVHALPNQDVSGHLLVAPEDVPARHAHLHMLYASIVHSDKPFMGSADGYTGAENTMEMASIVFGAEMLRKPVTICLIDSLSPLGYSASSIEALITYARARQPILLATVVMAGATGPITLAGLLAQQNAEILAGLTLAQFINPGAPVIYGSSSANMDMKTGMLAIGGPELALVVVGTAQMARYYALPSRGGGALTDAHTPDTQAGFESMMGLLTAVNSGVDFVLHAAGILSGYLAFSYEKFVIDDEMCGMVRQFRRGVTVSPETLAYDVMVNVGHNGNFLVESHTVERCRSEFWQPEICYRNGLDAWLADGRPDIVNRARKRWRQLLEAHVDPPLNATIVRQLRAFVLDKTRASHNQSNSNTTTRPVITS